MGSNPTRSTNKGPRGPVEDGSVGLSPTPKGWPAGDSLMEERHRNFREKSRVLRPGVRSCRLSRDGSSTLPLSISFPVSLVAECLALNQVAVVRIPDWKPI